MKKDSTKKNHDLLTLDEFIDREYGEKGAAKRQKFEQGDADHRLNLMMNDLPQFNKIIK
jgi:hypothetical protein